MRNLWAILLMMFGASILTPDGVIVAQGTTGADKPSQTRPALVVEPFTATDVGWPYDMKQLQSQTMAELKGKNRFNVVSDAPPETADGVYRLQGEVVEWHAGNRAKRWVVGMGSGRESAKIHYWLLDAKGAKVFEHTDVIRAEFWGNAYAGSVGELAHPFADKIAKRLHEAKLE